ncbi:hypothetical protein PR001_g30371 [Phytophthora rubi]|uniref:Uncharacterized protein n=1 Tax=Phytophthora rubi TaxID=129364 RepID=A0A6A3GUC7_9STRA|nr:hypothetical protein PR001_g30371 [Phytophthora rubi]
MEHNSDGDVTEGGVDLISGAGVPGGEGGRRGGRAQGGRGARGGRGAASTRGEVKKAAAKRSTRGRVWGNDEVLLLIKAWKAASLLRLPDGTTAKQVAASVYSTYISRLVAMRSEVTGSAVESVDEYLVEVANAPPRPEGGLGVADPNFRPRSRRALEDKMASLRSSYTLISDHNNGTLVGSTGRPEWFSLSTPERAEILKKWGRVALSSECYSALGDVFEDDPSITPVSGGVELGAVAHNSENHVVESPPKGKKRSRVDDIADVMHEVMAKAVKSMETIA